MKTSELENLSALAERYPLMQGLRIVPLGVPFAISGAGRAGWLDWVSASPGVRANLWFLVFFIALACGVFIGKHYTRRFGSVGGRDRGLRLMAIAAIFLVLLWLHRGPLE